MAEYEGKVCEHCLKFRCPCSSVFERKLFVLNFSPHAPKPSAASHHVLDTKSPSRTAAGGTTRGRLFSQKHRVGEGENGVMNLGTLLPLGATTMARVSAHLQDGVFFSCR